MCSSVRNVEEELVLNDLENRFIQTSPVETVLPFDHYDKSTRKVRETETVKMRRTPTKAPGTVTRDT